MRRPDQALYSLLRRVFRAETGMAAVEFALILPIMLTIWIGGVEVTQGLSVDRRLNNLAATIGDIVARCKAINSSDINAIFALDEAALAPFKTAGLTMRVSAVNVDNDKKATVGWSQAEGSEGVRPKDQTLDTSIIPPDLRVENTQIIMAEVFYTYSPALGYVITGDVNLDDRVYFTPRLVKAIERSTTSASSCSAQS